MGAFLTYQSVRQEARTDRAFARARSVFENVKGMSAASEVTTAGTSVVKFARTRCPGSALAVSPGGWLVSTGHWHHPTCTSRDDTFALLECLEEEGESVFDDLDGEYVIAWYDRRSETLMVVPDHLGRLHAYYAESNGAVFVATSPVALAAAVPSDPDPVAIYELLATGTIWEERSPFDSICRMRDTTRYFFRKGRLDATKRIVHRMVPRPGRLPGSGTLDDVIDAYQSSLSRSLEGYDRLVADLTGGYDTRLLVGFLCQQGYPLDVTVSGGSAHPDVRSAQSLADAVGLRLLREEPEDVIPYKSSFARVLRAASRVDGKYDAIEYVGIEHVQEVHADRYDVGINGAGGEMWRSFWWNSRHLAGTGTDSISWVLPRFAGLAIDPRFLDRTWTLDPCDHFAGILARSLEDRSEYAAHDRLDHFYVGVRMQNWQGTITTATNEIWPNLTLHLLRAPLVKIFDIQPGERLACRLANRMFRRFGRAWASCPLERGIPPQNLTAGNFWRFMLAARGIPAYGLNVWRERQARKVGVDPRSAAIVRNLFASGAADYMEARNMSLLPLFDRPKLEAFLETGRRTGEVPLGLLGRLIALESAFRASRG